VKWKTFSNTDPETDPFKANFGLQIHVELCKLVNKLTKLQSRTSLILYSVMNNKSSPHQG